MHLDASVSAIVTGGASGLGFAAAHAFVARGVRVSLFDNDAEHGERIARELGCTFCLADVTSETQTDAAFERARTANGQERLLVTCAGTANAHKTASRDKRTGAVSHFPLEHFQQIVAVNLVGTFRCIAKSAAGMLTLDPLEAGGERGAIVTTGSIAAYDGQAGQAAYAASKAGVAGMTLAIARDFMNDGIRINSILPGAFDTPLLASLPDHVREALAMSVPFPKRLGKPEEFASLAVEMIANGYMNGEQVRLDGAMRMPPR